MIIDLTKKNLDELHRRDLIRQNLHSVLTGKALVDERLFKVSNESRLKKTFSECAQERANNRMGRRGFSQDKETMSTARWDAEIYWLVAWVVDEIKDPVERDKARVKLLNQFSKFKTRDHL